MTRTTTRFRRTEDNRRRPLPAAWLRGTLTALLPLVARGAHAGTVTKMAIVSSSQTVAVSSCSAALTIRARDSSGGPANVPSDTTIYFDGSSASLSFYRDSSCSTGAIDTVVMTGGTSTATAYFKSSKTGIKTVAVSTYKYTNSKQSETIVSSSPSPSPSPSPSAAPSPLPSPSPSPSPTPSGGIRGRTIPSPVYGVTLDDISNLGGEITSLQNLNHMPTTRIVFDTGEPPSYYSGAIQKLRPVTYTMGQLADSSYMPKYSVSSITTWTQNYVNALGSNIDVWEVGNEVNGNWLGANTMQKIEAMYDVVSAQNGATALTFFYEGEPSDPNNCIGTDQYGGTDMFTWINQQFQLGLPPSQRSAETEKIRLGLSYVLVSWYPDQCQGEKPDWTWVYSQLASIFPNAQVGFGELGTANPQYGSQYEINEIDTYYPMATITPLPARYIGGYFWWYFAEEMVPDTTTLFGTLNNAIK